MDEKKRSEVLAFFWFVTSVLTLLALLSYTPNDIAFEVSTANSPAHNFVGIAGAYTAWFLVMLFGRTSYFLVPLFLFWALAKWFGKKSQKLWLKLFATVIFLTSSCALFSLLNDGTKIGRFQAGGVLGYFSSLFLAHLFGRAGIFVALSLFLLSILLTTELLILQITGSLLKRLKIPWPLFHFERKPGSQKPILQKVTTTIINSKFPEMKEAIVEKMRPQPQIRVSVPKAPVPLPKEKAMMSEETSDGYRLPDLDLLELPLAVDQNKIKGGLEASSRVLEDTLRDFGIEAKVVEVEQGPTITRYELQPAASVKVQRITSLENDISLAMRATSVRIVAPIPGKSRVGIEVPNGSASTVFLREVLASA